MRLEITAYTGVGPVKFGMTREEVRLAVGPPVRPFMKTPDDELPTDAFDDLGVHVYYKKPGVCEAVEMGSPAEPTFRGQVLIGRPYSELRRWFESLDESVETDDTGLLSYKYGVGLYAPAAEEEPDEPVEGVIVFERGYYETP
ncbi:MAG TPA: hypothetical protein VER08_00090 [Pyrinomonadaceae bacterium]|nr:hypothetical protein [Pyrinomonadaceae bacterium]